MPHPGTSEVQDHPYEPWIPDRARTLILGSAPPWRFCVIGDKPLSARDMDWYYGSCDRGCNLLWEVLFRVLEPSSLQDLEHIRALDSGPENKAKTQRDFLQSFLERHELALADILKRFARRDRKAPDSGIVPLEFTDLLGILASHPKLENILCTSRNKVFLWLKQYLAAQGSPLRESETVDWHEFYLNRRIRVRILPSPSPIGQIRFPSHQAFVGYLVGSYRQILGSLDHTPG